MKEDPGLSNTQAWGCPCTPNKYLRRLKRLILGMPPCIPFSINNNQFVLLHTIFLLLHMIYAVLGASLLLVLFCLLVITMSDPSMLDRERYTLHFIIEHSRASLIFVEC